MTFEAGDVVVVPFPFTDQNATKRRPALVLSQASTFNQGAGHIVVAMITSKGHDPWPLDTPLRDWAAAGLTSPSLVRFKLFTLDERLIIRKAGRLSAGDASKVKTNLKKLVIVAD